MNLSQQMDQRRRGLIFHNRLHLGHIVCNLQLSPEYRALWAADTGTEGHKRAQLGIHHLNYLVIFGLGLQILWAHCSLVGNLHYLGILVGILLSNHLYFVDNLLHFECILLFFVDTLSLSVIVSSLLRIPHLILLLFEVHYFLQKHLHCSSTNSRLSQMPPQG